MIPLLFKPYENAAYPCYLLSTEGELYMNEAARAANVPFSDENRMLKILNAASRLVQHEAGPMASSMPLVDGALNMRMMTLLPTPDGILVVVVDEHDAPAYLYSGQMREYLTNIFAVLPLLTKHLEDVDHRYTDEIQKNCYGLLRMASNLEDVSRVEPREAKHPVIDLAALVSAICYCTESLRKDDGAPVEWEVPKQPVLVRADQRLLGEAVLNVLRNSMQYTRDGNRIQVRLKVVGGRAVLTIEDKGLGILPENLEHIFEPYFSVDPYGDSMMRPGLGLGLSVLREAMTEFGGSVSVESRFGEGTGINMALPIDEGGETVLDSDPTDYLLNRYSPVYVQLSGFCRLPDLS